MKGTPVDPSPAGEEARAFSLPAGEGRVARSASRGGDTALAAPHRPEGRPRSDLPRHLPRELRQRLTAHEAKLWVALRRLQPAGYHFRRQVPIGRFIVDFACLQRRLVIEVDGGQHNDNAHAERDLLRDADLRGRGYVVQRFWNAEIDADLRSVMDTIVARLEAADPTRPGSARPPSPAGRENPRKTG